jgi:hypothetical protein
VVKVRKRDQKTNNGKVVDLLRKLVRGFATDHQYTHRDVRVEEFWTQKRIAGVRFE